MTIPHLQDKTPGCVMGTPPGLGRFSAVLDFYPAGFAGNALNLLFLDDALAIGSPRNYLREIHGPWLMDERREYVLAESFWPFPAIEVSERPDPYALSERLFQRFDEADQIVPIQTDIARVVEEEAVRSGADVVALMIVDGLGYYDLPEDTEASPFLVNGVSTTEFGYVQAAGRPSLSSRLFTRGYTKQLGFTYFLPEDNDLASEIYKTFSPSQVVQVREFDAVLQHLRSQRILKAYVQISTSGLDQVCHSFRDRPPCEHILQQVMHRFESLVECLTRPHCKVLACLTSDHGILWRESIEGQAKVVHDLLPEDTRSTRHLRGRFLRDYARCHTHDGHNYTLLAFPYLTRKLRRNEWGVHGGISAWESIVPLLMKLV